MIKKAKKNLSRLPPKVPSVSEEISCRKKRSKGFDGSSKTPFEPSWGICAQDSVMGSLALALDWSKWSVTPPDMVRAFVGDKL